MFGEKSPKEKKQARLTAAFVFLLTLSLIALASVGRTLPALWAKIISPVVVVSQQFSPVSPVVPSVTPNPAIEQSKKILKETLDSLQGEYGLYYENLETKESFSLNGQRKFPAASLIKLPTILTLYTEAEAGRINLETIYKLAQKDKRDGAGSLYYQPVGYSVSYRQMARLMGQQSDNTAYHVISTVLTGSKIQALITNLGMKNTNFADQITTPEDIGLFYRTLYQGKIVSSKSQEEIFSFLTNSNWEDRIPAKLPKNLKVVHKIGSLVGVYSDAGIVFAVKPYILVVMSENANEIEAKKILPEISEKIYEMNEKIANR